MPSHTAVTAASQQRALCSANKQPRTRSGATAAWHSCLSCFPSPPAVASRPSPGYPGPKYHRWPATPIKQPTYTGGVSGRRPKAHTYVNCTATPRPRDCRGVAAAPAAAPGFAPAPWLAPAPGFAPWAGALAPGYAPDEVPAEVLQEAKRPNLPRGVFYDDQGYRWAIGGGQAPELLDNLEEDDETLSDEYAHQGSHSLSAGIIAGVAIGVAVLLALFIWVLVCCCQCCCGRRSGCCGSRRDMEQQAGDEESKPANNMTMAGNGGGVHTVGGARSLNDGVACTVSITNSSTAWVKLFWLDYNGVAQDYGCVQPGVTHTLNTFATHCWRITNADACAVVTEFAVSPREPRTVLVWTDKAGWLQATLQ